MVNIVNLTPHSVNYYAGDHVEVIKPSGLVARVVVYKDIPNQVRYYLDNEDGFNRISITQNLEVMQKQVVNLPEIRSNTIYIVSTLVQLLHPRADLVSPDETVRDENGRIIGCRAFKNVVVE